MLCMCEVCFTATVIGRLFIGMIFVLLHIQVAQGMHTQFAKAFLWLALSMPFTNGISRGLAQLIALKKTCSATVVNLEVEFFLAGSPIWYCMWYQWIVHEYFHDNLAEQSGNTNTNLDIRRT